MTSTLTSFAVLLFAASGFRTPAVEVTSIREVGDHHPILVVEKNVNPQNKLVVYTKLDERGRFLTDTTDPSRPVLDFYWLMDGKKYKPVNPMIKKEIRKRFVSQWKSGADASRFTVKVNDLKEVKCDIEDPQIDVYASGTGNGVDVGAQMNLGPSDDRKRIHISTIYTEGRSFPPAVDSVTLKGDEVLTGNGSGRKVSRTYSAAGKK